MRKRFLPIALTLLPWFSAGIAAAAGATLPTNILSNSTAVVTLLCNIMNWVFYVLIVTAVIMVIYAAFLYATSSGDSEKVSKANRTFVYVAVAVAVALIAKGVPSIVGSILGVTSGLNACS